MQGSSWGRPRVRRGRQGYKYNVCMYVCMKLATKGHVSDDIIDVKYPWRYRDREQKDCWLDEQTGDFGEQVHSLVR